MSDVLSVPSVRNPPWSRDELILALALYLNTRSSPPGKTSGEIAQLSVTLNRLGRTLDGDRQADYRNPNGVYMKLMNFRRFDPEYKAQGKIGLTRGNKDEAIVWDQFSGSVERLNEVAGAIVMALDNESENLSIVEDVNADVEGAPEGRLLTRLHRYRERNRRIVDAKKSQAMTQNGNLSCEACGFDFASRYGERGFGFIEAHHTKPLRLLSDRHRTMLADLALLCANCHRMVHASRPWLTMKELRALVAGAS